MRNYDIFSRIYSFQKEVHRLLGRYEASQSRVIQLTKTYTDLRGLSIQQDDLFKQALRCMENELYRAAHVMAWASFMAFLEEKITRKGFRDLHAAYPKWSAYKTVEDLREHVSEYQLVDAAKKLKLCTKGYQAQNCHL